MKRRKTFLILIFLFSVILISCGKPPKANIPHEKPKLDNDEEIVLYVGDSYQISSKNIFELVVDNEEVASVSGNTITGIKEGETFVTAIFVDYENESMRVDIKIVEPFYGVKDVTIKNGSSYTFEALEELFFDGDYDRIISIEGNTVTGIGIGEVEVVVFLKSEVENNYIELREKTITITVE